ncbi:hypothetical protein FTX61_14760 [Nitriliruptoraceae bacterium ZYF776]|nr:hypothetical protein [Profundirhabdus halotolerans]
MRRPVELLIRVAVSLSVVVVVVHAVVVGEVADATVLTTVIVGGIVLAAAGFVPDRGAEPPLALVLTVGLVGLVALTVALLFGLDADPRRFTLIHAVAIVAAAFGMPARVRSAYVAVAVAACAIVLVADPRTDHPAVVGAQLGGLVLTGWITLRVVQAYEAAIVAESASRSAAERRAGSLASVLALQRLDLDAVRAAVVEGAERAGLRGVELRDPDDPEAAVAPPGWVAVPIRTDGEVVAWLVGDQVRDVADPDVRETVELLAEEAGRALGRAAQYAAEAAMVAELRRLDQLAHDVVSTVSHELRTPLTVVDGLGATLHARWDELSVARRADLAGRVAANAERLSGIVRALAGPAAFEDGALRLHPRPIAVAPMVDALVARLAELLAGHPVSVAVDDVVVVADPDLLDRVLENLLTNAAKHTPPGTEVRVTTTRVDGEVELAVVDDGPGIGPDDLPHVFERFYRAGGPTTRAAGGLGLGLPLARQVVHAHGGELTVESSLGLGTRFVFRLPEA